jgi:hypothetical protein
VGIGPGKKEMGNRNVNGKCKVKLQVEMGSKGGKRVWKVKVGSLN